MHSPTMFVGRETAWRAMIYLTLLVAAVQVPMSRCQSSTPTHPQGCKEHQQELEQFKKTPEYSQSFLAALPKHATKSLQVNDVITFYQPQCDEITGLYLAKQCSPFPLYCWCSTPDGTPINGTAQYDMPVNYCSKFITVDQEKSCVVDGQTYVEGKIFTPSDVCGQCECSSGSYSCFVNYTVDGETGYLSNDQLDSFKIDLVQVFSALCNSSDDNDVRQVLKAPVAMDDSFTERKREILCWKFTDYDRNEDNVLNPTEAFLFRTDITKYFGRSGCFDHLNQLLDTNGNGQISPQEWLTFFGLSSPVTNASATCSGDVSSGEHKPAKREARHLARKPLHLRKKFHFVYSDGLGH